MKKTLLILLALILVVALGLAAKLFIIGSPVDSSIISCQVQEDSNQLNIYVTTPASAIAFTDARLHQEDTTLYITFRKVLVSPLYDSGQKSIYIENCDLTQVILGGEIIWTKSE